MTAAGRDIVAALTFQPPALGWLGSLALAGGIVGVILAYTVGLRSREHAPPTRMVLLALRLGAVTAVLVALWHPRCVRDEVVLELPALAVVLDNSRSMSMAVDADRSRYERAVDILGARLAPEVRDTHALRVFDVRARALALDGLPGEPTVPESPLTDALLRVQRDLRDERLSGIVLLSDGREVTQRVPAGDVERLRVPVHVVRLIGESGVPAPANLAIEAVSVNRRALVGNDVRVVVDIAGEGLAADARVPVVLLDGAHTLARATVAWREGQRAARAELSFLPRRAGEFEYIVEVGGPWESDEPETVPRSGRAGRSGEAALGDNRETFALHVSAKPLTVLFVDGVLRWEGKFVREALAEDPDTNVVAAVRSAPPGSDHGSQGLLLPEQLANIDVVILGDIEATFFSTSELAALRTWVMEGGAVLVAGGYRSFGPDGLGATVLRDVLPVEFSGDPNPQDDRPFSLKLTTAGQQHPIFSLTRDRVRDTAFFHALPPLAGCSRVAGVKPGAEVLAVNPEFTVSDSGCGLPILVVQEIGAGRAMVLAVDTTWRWRMVVGGFTGDSSFYPQFWGQLVRWLARDEVEPAARLIVATDRRQYRAGQPIRLSGVLRGFDGAGDEAEYRVSALALSEGGDRWEVPLTERPGDRFQGTLIADRAGRIDFCVRAEPLGMEADTPELSAIATVDVERSDVESADVRPDPRWLAQVAQRTGGRIVPPDQIAAWARTVPGEPLETVRAAANGPAGERFLGAVFLVLLCGEWILRRRLRLV